MIDTFPPNSCSSFPHVVKWAISACPAAEKLDPYYVAPGHAVDYAVQAHRETPQAVPEGGYPALEAYHAAMVRTEWTNAWAEMLVFAYEDPDTLGITKAHER